MSSHLSLFACCVFLKRCLHSARDCLVLKVFHPEEKKPSASAPKPSHAPAEKVAPPAGSLFGLYFSVCSDSSRVTCLVFLVVYMFCLLFLLVGLEIFTFCLHAVVFLVLVVILESSTFQVSPPVEKKPSAPPPKPSPPPPVPVGKVAPVVPREKIAPPAEKVAPPAGSFFTLCLVSGSVFFARSSVLLSSFFTH